MNERIRELAEQARAEVRAEWDKGNKIPYPEAHYQFMNDNDQKFAELVIKECARIAVFEPSGTISTADVAGHVAAGRLTAAKLIKEHFGFYE